tara:strand:+ start:1303 stop:1872 length:570 start_codon:yes stop_codon:yes gene_type:complete
MKDNILKKEFKKRDVDRIRNIMTGDTDSRTTQGVGYSKGEIVRKEGDIWSEDGRQWTVKDGLKQNITRLDKAKAAIKPMFCPNCSNIMNQQHDDLFYMSHKKCYSCVVNMESTIKSKGLWEEYQAKIQNTDVENFIKDYTNFIMTKLDESNMGFVTEAGDVERWKGSINKDKVLANLDKTIEYLESFKK